MSIWNVAGRWARSVVQQPPAPSTANEARPKDGAGAASGSAQAKDSFTPSPSPGPSPTRPDLSGGANEGPSGYSKPVRADELPDIQNGTGVLTLNLANGAGSEYRTAKNREEQAELIRETGATIAGFQEVDIGVDRSGNANTALDIARHLNPAFEAFKSGTVPTVGLHEDAPATAIRKGADGTTLYQTPEGTLVTGESFSGDDRSIKGDTGADATYGNAIYVGAPDKVVDAYTVTLPAAESGGPAVSTKEDLAALGDGKLTESERKALGERNEALRKNSPSEPRTALVTRVVGPDGQEKSIINVHLAAGKEGAGLREKQLQFLAEVARAEAKGPPARELVVMGDFNDSTENVGKALEGAGLHRVVGGKKANGDNFDQVWVSGGLDTHNAAQVKTDGVSDHAHAGYAIIR
ncbi:endonuclease/exonuclease/phosphatase family protein [Myxococcus faecalis]|uniref:endonuclease/exonuclease/phosphatase family protein n=1 Tax=Myxococcus faecalis TaxID=3115646 RepID=UPI003CFA683E